VQDLNVNAALNGEQLTIERITGNVATGGIVGSFSAKGAAKVPQLTSPRSTAPSCSTRRSSRFSASGRAAAAVALRFLERQRHDRRRDVAGCRESRARLAAQSASPRDPPLEPAVKGLVDLRDAVGADERGGVRRQRRRRTRASKARSAKPLLDGRITLDGAEIAIAEPRVVLSDLIADRSYSTASARCSTACAVLPTAARWRSTARSNSKAWH
jgi:hypothetical protein